MLLCVYLPDKAESCAFSCPAVVSEDIVVTLLGVGIYAGALARRAALQSINQRNMKRYQEAQHAAAVATQ